MLALCLVHFFKESYFPLWKIHNRRHTWKHKVKPKRMRQNRKKKKVVVRNARRIELCNCETWVKFLFKITSKSQCACCQCAYCWISYRNICMWYNKASDCLLENWNLFGWGWVFLNRNRKSRPENVWAVWDLFFLDWLELRSIFEVFLTSYIIILLALWWKAWVFTLVPSFSWNVHIWKELQTGVVHLRRHTH